ncbi:amidase [Virgibacillus halodenitrificans]|uniref:Amidase n=1 Tax=Virgibacillus halodenitrificans TaxID=1482 RepID=A0AAC9J1S9_VIRHA|nr:amidase [Virgibacillus halodenitrificans]APC48933.1 amidase [Virgibacillus halodenitrificans]MBD1223392.1 amidase [Virgibacillus halodenitrificans]MCG1026970.1 amidase [Virgibacillus halodenitrificans]MEC2159018.1 amidase [Virgibacillus halodenitrificans]MYL56833.1 amidase [Virgibacillus halodenitrificans]
MSTLSVKEKEQILSADTVELVNKFNNKELTSVEIVSTYIEHNRKVNPEINAIVEERYEKALEEAKKADDRKTSGLLRGIPITVKEAIHVKEMKTTGGLEQRQDLIAREDAKVIRKLKESGAIILGKTNTPALCFCQETENKLYGRTNNPWDVNRTAGGSSGGEGAILATGGAAAGIGSDIGGSIRFPAHFNGIIGFKPGMNQVPTKGHFPSVLHPLQERMLSIGPMGKSVRDMEFIYSILGDETFGTRYLQDFKIEILPGNNSYPLSGEQHVLLDQIEETLSKTYSTRRCVPPYLEESALLWQEVMSIEGSKPIEKAAFNNVRSNVYSAFLREKLTQRTNIHPYLSWAIIGSKLFKPSAGRIREIHEIIKKGDQMLEEYLQHRLLVFPVYHKGALPHGKVYQEIFSIRKSFLQYMPYVAYANIWGLPSLTIPVGKDENNMPVAIQIMSINGNEDAIFRLGKIIEKKFRGYIRCTRYE